MLKARKITQAHEDLFAANYDRLFLWALQLTHNDRTQAEDLLHDAFIQFTITQPDLQTIQNLEGYLYGTLRNLQLSQVRKATRSRLQQLSIVEYESAETGLRSIKSSDPRDLIQVQDELRRVCHYVCVRKETARAASVLLLRFFHGYYPGEIAQVLQTTSQAVRVRLRIARSEAKASLDNTKSVAFLGENPVVEVLPTGFARTPKDILSELRQTIFRTRRSACLSPSRIQELYHSNKTPVETKDLAHLVSCDKCLDSVNKILGLPSLADRSPIDSIERDKGSRGGPGGTTGGSAPGGGAGTTTMKSLRRQAREVFEHDPQELCVAINGYIQGSQKINSETSELTLDIGLAEPISFVEIFSEQQIRLLLMNVDDTPPVGPGEQSLRVGLSEGRSLELQLRFGSPWPTLHVAYHDPTFKEVESLTSKVQSEDSDVALTAGVGHRSESGRPADAHEKSGLRTNLGKSWSDLGLGIFDFGLFFRPGTVTAIVALLVIASLIAVRLHRGPESIATLTDLLHRASATEDAIAARTDQVLHRTINLEERKLGGELIAVRSIEVWQSAERGITARRLYDDRGSLLAGDWRRSDGVQTLYSHGSRPQIKPVPDKHTSEAASINFENAWQLSPSAKDFSALVGDSNNLRVEERPAEYVISYSRSDHESGANGLAKATLILSRADLHVTEEILTIRQGSEVRDYRMMEASFERRPPAAVAPSVFEPDAVLLSSLHPEARNSNLETATSTPGSIPLNPLVATAAQEIEVLRLLSSIGADLGEEVSVQKTPDGQLLVQGVLDTERRKNEILHALRPLSNDRAIKLDLITTAEAARRQGQRLASNPSVVLQQSEPTDSRIPAHAELERYFAGRGLAGEQLNAEVLRFTERTLARSRQVMLRAGALKRLAARFSPEKLRTLDQDSHAKWLGLIHAHAVAIQRQNDMLRRDLALVFPPVGGAQLGGETSVTSDAGIFRAAEHLFDLCAKNDHSVSAAFVLSSGGAGGTTIRTPQFWRSLADVDRQSSELARASQPGER